MRRAGDLLAARDGRWHPVPRPDRLPVALPARTLPALAAVWQQWRRWRESGVWARAMTRLAQIVRVRHGRNPTPSVVMIDAQTAKGGRAGPTFHEAGGRGGRTVGAKRSILIEILGLPIAARVDPARPHDVKVGRELLAERLPTLPGVRAVVADRGYRGLAALASRRHVKLDIKAPPKGRSASRRSRRSTRSSTPSPNLVAGGGCRAAMRGPRRAPALGSKSRRSATCWGGCRSGMRGQRERQPPLTNW